jgi:hypothetical protein
LYELHSPDTRQSDGQSALGLLLRNADYLPVEAQLECAQLLIERGCSLGSSFVALLVNVLQWPFFKSRGDASGHTTEEAEQRLQLLRMLARHKDWKLGELTIEQKTGPLVHAVVHSPARIIRYLVRMQGLRLDDLTDECDPPQ